VSGEQVSLRVRVADTRRPPGRAALEGEHPTQNPEVVALQLWSCVHRFVTLELGDHFAQFTDPVGQVLQSSMVTLLVGLGDTAELARHSLITAARMQAELAGRTAPTRPTSAQSAAAR
jgi:hypothetical protein